MIDYDKLNCPNGHHRKFFATYTSVSWKVVGDADGKLKDEKLKDLDGALFFFHCADCGATTVIEVDKDGIPVHE